MEKRVILIGILAVLIVVVAVMLLFHNSPPPASIPSSTTSSPKTIAQPTTTILTSSVSPYITWSQAQSLIGGSITSQTTKVYNTPAEIASLDIPYNANNITEIWITSYTNATNHSITEFAVLSKTQVPYSKITSNIASIISRMASNSSNKFTSGTQNGMSYEVGVTHTNNATDAVLMGWKGNYSVSVYMNNETLNTSLLAGVVAGDLP